MFIPLHDRNDLDHINLQFVTLGLIVINTVIWLGTTFSGETGAFTTAAVLGFGYIPAVANGFADLAPGLAIVPEEATYITYAFLHGGFWHPGEQHAVPVGNSAITSRMRWGMSAS